VAEEPAGGVGQEASALVVASVDLPLVVLATGQLIIRLIQLDTGLAQNEGCRSWGENHVVGYFLAIACRRPLAEQHTLCVIEGARVGKSDFE
jgi:hypothetical protein